MHEKWDRTIYGSFILSLYITRTYNLYTYTYIYVCVCVRVCVCDKCIVRFINVFRFRSMMIFNMFDTLIFCFIIFLVGIT